MTAVDCSLCQEDQSSVRAGAERMLLGNFRETEGAASDLEVLRELGASSLAVELRKARLTYVPHLVCVEQSLLAAVLQSSPDDP